ncbi:MAG: hypothetical protein WCH44_18175, partial [Betaproteobacteria bacterium]
PSYRHAPGKLRRRRRRVRKNRAAQIIMAMPKVQRRDTDGEEEMAAILADGSTLFLRDAEHTSSLDWEDPWRIFGAPFPKSEAEATARLQTWVDRNAKKGASLTPAQR